MTQQPIATLLFEIGLRFFALAATSSEQKSEISGGRISFSKGRIMAAVIEAFETTGTGLRLKDLQTVTGLSKSTLSETIDELVKNELLIRQPSRTDRRAIEILPTKKGIRSMKVTSQKLDDLWENITADIPENDRAVFHNVLMQVSQTLKCQ